eukprot:RCo040246
MVDSRGLKIAPASELEWGSSAGLKTPSVVEYGRPHTPKGWKYCGHFPRSAAAWVIRDDFADDSGPDAASAKPGCLAPPVNFVQVWVDTGTKLPENYTIWKPIPRDGYVALGLYIAFKTPPGERPFPKDPDLVCVHESLVQRCCHFVEPKLWSPTGSGAKEVVILGIKEDHLLWPSEASLLFVERPSALLPHLLQAGLNGDNGRPAPLYLKTPDPE